MSDLIKEYKNIYIPIIILNIFVILISLYLSIMFIKSKRLHIYPCYNCLIINFIILLDNILRMIPLPSNVNDIFKYMQAFLLTSLDKLLLAIISFQAFIVYLGVVKTKFYYYHEKTIFFSGLSISIFVSLAIGVFYILKSEKSDKEPEGLAVYGLYYYCSGEIESKKIIDVIFNSIFLFINTFSISIILIYMFRKKEKAEEGMIEDLDYGRHYTKILLMLIVNSLAFIDSYLIIYDELPVPYEYIDLVYISVCLLIDIYYTFNKITYMETLKLFCRKIYDKKYPSVKDDETTTIEDTRNTELKEVKSSEI
jgi:hypothetical protein